MPIESREQFEALRDKLKAGEYAHDQELQAELIRQAQEWKAQNQPTPITNLEDSQLALTPIVGQPDPEGPASGGLTGVAEGLGSGLIDLVFGTGKAVSEPSGVGLPLPLALSSIALDRGTDTLFGQTPNQVISQAVDDKAVVDEPLSQSPAGQVGRVGANLAAVGPLSFVRGANTLRGATALGTGLGTIQPSDSIENRAANTTAGAAFGLGGQFVGNQVAKFAGNRLASREAERAVSQAAAQPTQDLVKAGAREGLVVPPATSNPSFLNRMVEGAAGKTRVAQSASVVNQKQANRIARETLGIDSSTPLTKATVAGIRKDSGQIYQQIRGTGTVVPDESFSEGLQTLRLTTANIKRDFPDLKIEGAKEIDELISGLDQGSFSAEGAIEVVKRLRNDASTLFKSFDDPAKLELAKATRAAADLMDDQILRHLQTNGFDDLAAAYQPARQRIAQTYTIDAALNEAGNINSRVLGNMVKKGKPLSGGLETLGRFAESFPQATKLADQSFQLFSPLDLLGFGGAGIGVGSVSPSAGGAIASLPIMRALLARGAVSGVGQRAALPSEFTQKIGDTGLTLLDVIGQRGGLLGASAAPLVADASQ